jgi:hypothetical protein
MAFSIACLWAKSSHSRKMPGRETGWRYFRWPHRQGGGAPPGTRGHIGASGNCLWCFLMSGMDGEVKPAIREVASAVPSCDEHPVGRSEATDDRDFSTGRNHRTARVPDAGHEG